MVVKNVQITVVRKNIKNMYIRVLPPDGIVEVSAPHNVSEKEIVTFVESKLDWISKKQEEIRNTDYPPEFMYVTGEKHCLWGEEYTLQLITDNVKTPFIKDDNIYLPVSKKRNMENREKKLNELYRAEVKREISNIYERCVNKVGEKPLDVKIRKMKNWGNCKKNRVITLNLNLAKKPKECLEYVFIHELCHLIEFNHSKNFWMLMDENCPNWREIKEKLDE